MIQLSALHWKGWSSTAQTARDATKQENTAATVRETSEPFCRAGSVANWFPDLLTDLTTSWKIVLGEVCSFLEMTVDCSCISPYHKPKNGQGFLLQSGSIYFSPSSSPDGRLQLQIISWAFGRIKCPKYFCGFLAPVCLFPDVCSLFSVKYFPDQYFNLLVDIYSVLLNKLC